MKLGFSRQILKNFRISSFIDISALGTELFREDGQT